MVVNTLRAREVEVSSGGLLPGALPRVDWSDAYAVTDVEGLPEDPQVWADAVFRGPPTWVRLLLGLREALVGLVGIERAGSSAFDTLERTDTEVLLGIDQRHLTSARRSAAIRTGSWSPPSSRSTTGAGGPTPPWSGCCTRPWSARC